MLFCTVYWSVFTSESTLMTLDLGNTQIHAQHAHMCFSSNVHIRFCLHMCIYVHIVYMHVQLCLCMHAGSHMNAFPHINMHMNACMYAHMAACMYECIYIFMCNLMQSLNTWHIYICRVSSMYACSNNQMYACAHVHGTKSH